METYLLIATIITFLIYSLYEQIKASLYVSKCFTKEVKSEHSYIVRVKALMLPKSMWLNDVKGIHIPNLVKANECWQNYLKRAFISFGIFVIVLLIFVSPSIYYLLTH